MQIDVVWFADWYSCRGSSDVKGVLSKGQGHNLGWLNRQDLQHKPSFHCPFLIHRAKGLQECRTLCGSVYSRPERDVCTIHATKKPLQRIVCFLLLEVMKVETAEAQSSDVAQQFQVKWSWGYSSPSLSFGNLKTSGAVVAAGAKKTQQTLPTGRTIPPCPSLPEEGSGAQAD